MLLPYVFTKVVVEVDLLDRDNNEINLTQNEKEEVNHILTTEMNKLKENVKNDYKIDDKNIFQHISDKNDKINIINYDNNDNLVKNMNIINNYVEIIYKYIPISTDLYNYFVLNDNQLYGKSKIKNILIFKDKNGRFYDFYKKIEFFKEGRFYTDKSNNLIAYKKIFNSYEDLVRNGKMSENGFYVYKKIDRKVERANSNLLRKTIAHDYIKKLNLSEIKLDSRMTQRVIDDVKHILNTKLKYPVTRSIIQYEFNDLKPDDKIEVCVCKDKRCKGSCDEIRLAYRRDVHDMLL